MAQMTEEKPKESQEERERRWEEKNRLHEERQELFHNKQMEHHESNMEVNQAQLKDLADLAEFRKSLLKLHEASVLSQTASALALDKIATAIERKST